MLRFGIFEKDLLKSAHKAMERLSATRVGSFAAVISPTILGARKH